jgi:hypothetical protein
MKRTDLRTLRPELELGVPRKSICETGDFR